MNVLGSMVHGFQPHGFKSIHWNLSKVCILYSEHLSIADTILGNQITIFFWNLPLYSGHLSIVDIFFEKKDTSTLSIPLVRYWEVPLYKISAIWLVNEHEIFRIFEGGIFFEQSDWLSAKITVIFTAAPLLLFGRSFLLKSLLNSGVECFCVVYFVHRL